MSAMSRDHSAKRKSSAADLAVKLSALPETVTTDLRAEWRHLYRAHPPKRQVVEGMITLLFKELKGIDLSSPFTRLPWKEAIGRYGTDKPDLRFGLELKDFSSCFQGSQVKVFSGVLEKGGIVKGLHLPGGASLSRKELDNLTGFVGNFGAKGLAWIKLTDKEWQSPITKFLSEDERSEISKITGAKSGDIILFLADEAKVVHEALGNLRLHLGEKMGTLP